MRLGAVSEDLRLYGALESGSCLHFALQESVGSTFLFDTALPVRTREDILRLKELELAHSVRVFDQAARSYNYGVSPSFKELISTVEIIHHGE